MRDLPRPEFIRHTRDLRALVDRLKDEPLLAVDTESNSLYAYYEQVCLVQLSTRQQDIIVDPLAVDDMSPLGDLLADPAIEIVFHAAEYDVITLKRDFGYSFTNLFDTMLAARVCGWPKIGLGSLLEAQFGVHVKKKYQRADWSRRPLPAEQLQYAQMDTHYLPNLRDRLEAELIEMGRLEEARETFAALEELPPTEHHFDPNGFWRIHAVRDLARHQLATARELYLLRDDIARRWDWPPFKVFTNKTLVRLAREAPRRLDDLYATKGLNKRLVRREGQAILDAIERGRKAKTPRRPRRPEPPAPEILERYDMLQSWRKEQAAARGVESDIIVPRETLWALARRAPGSVEDLDDIPGLGPWRRAKYGAELIALLDELRGDH